MFKNLICLAVLSLVCTAATSPARADDEGSEHTSQLVGDESDTIGVTVSYDKRAGWTMDLRPKPGANVRHIALPFLPADHAHYWAVVGAKRKAVTFVMSSRESLSKSTTAIWVVSAAGKLVRKWKLGSLLSGKQIKGLERSVSHVAWLKGKPQLTATAIILATPYSTIAVHNKRRKLTLTKIKQQVKAKRLRVAK